jgi:outer membrane protein
MGRHRGFYVPFRPPRAILEFTGRRMPIVMGMNVYGMILTLMLCAQTVPVRADDQKGKAPENAKPEIYLGAGALLMSEPYRGVPMRVYAVPLFAYEGRRLYVRGLNVGYRLIQGKGWSIGPVLQPRFDGYKSSDSSALSGMRSRRMTVDTGVGFEWRSSWGLFSLSWVADILGRHDGHETEFAYTLLFPWKGFSVIPSAGLRCKSNNLTDYYYGVESNEALPGRPSYRPGLAIDPFIRVVVKRGLVGPLSALGAVQCEWFDDGIRDSPIVDRAYGTSFLLGLLYTF